MSSSKRHCILIWLLMSETTISEWLCEIKSLNSFQNVGSGESKKILKCHYHLPSDRQVKNFTEHTISTDVQKTNENYDYISTACELSPSLEFLRNILFHLTLKTKVSISGSPNWYFTNKFQKSTWLVGTPVLETCTEQVES